MCFTLFPLVIGPISFVVIFLSSVGVYSSSVGATGLIEDNYHLYPHMYPFIRLVLEFSASNSPESSPSPSPESCGGSPSWSHESLKKRKKKTLSSGLVSHQISSTKGLFPKSTYLIYFYFD